MPLTSLGFLFVFLPAGGLLYYFLRGVGRRVFLLCYSLLFVGLLSPLCLLLLLAVTVPDYLLARHTPGRTPSCWPPSPRTSRWPSSAPSSPSWAG